MKSLNIFIILLLLLGVVGCGKEDSKEVTPTNLEKNFNANSESDQTIKAENNGEQNDQLRDISTDGISKDKEMNN